MTILNHAHSKGKVREKNLKKNSNLASIGVGPRVGHAQGERPIVAKLGTYFILELSAPDGLAPGTDARRIAGLDHELLDHLDRNNIIFIEVVLALIFTPSPSPLKELKVTDRCEGCDLGCQSAPGPDFSRCQKNSVSCRLFSKMARNIHDRLG